MEIKKITKEQLIKEAQNPWFGDAPKDYPEKFKRKDKEPWQMSPEEKQKAQLKGDYAYKQRDSEARPTWFQKDDEASRPDAYIYKDPFDEDKDAVVVIVPNGLDLVGENELKNSFPDFYDYLKSSNKVNFYFLQMKKLPKDEPMGVGRNLKLEPGHEKFSQAQTYIKKRRGAFGTKADELGADVRDFFPKTSEKGEKQSDREKNLRKIYPSLREGQDTINQKLNNSALPQIPVPDRLIQQAGVERHSLAAENTDIRIGLWYQYFFNRLEDYIEVSRLLSRGREFGDLPDEIKPRATHQPRRDNPGKRWSELRKLEDMSDDFKIDPKTKKYYLDKRGYSENDYTVTTGIYFTIFGTPQNDNTFKWVIGLTAGFTSKLVEERYASKPYADIDEFTFTSEAVSQPYNQLEGPNGTIGTNESIMSAFRQAYDDLISKVQEVDSKQLLRNRYREFGNQDITRQIQESLIQQVLSEIKK